jgi:MFS family permease
MLWFVCLLNYADRQVVSSVFPILSRDLHFTKVQLGAIGSAFMLVYAFGAPFAGYISDRCNRKNLILGGCLFWSGITVFTARCVTLLQFVTVRAMEGLGETFYFPASMSLISDYHGAETRSRALSFHQSSVYAGTIMGSWVGAVIAEKYNWRYAFYLFGTLGVVLALALYKALREPARGEAEHRDKLREHIAALDTYPIRESARFSFLLNPTVLLLMAAFICANSIATVFLVWTPTYLVEKYHFKLSAAGLSGQVYSQVASAIAVPIAGILADRLARRIKAGRIVVQAAGLFAGAVFVSLVGSTTAMSTLLLAMTAFGFCKGFYDSGIFASLYDCVGPSARGSAAGMMNTVGWGGGALGPVVVGWISQHGRQNSEMANMSNAISFGGLIYLLGAVLLTIAAIRSTRHSAVISQA